MCYMGLLSGLVSWAEAICHNELYREGVNLPSSIFSSSVCVFIYLSASFFSNATHSSLAQSGLFTLI